MGQRNAKQPRTLESYTSFDVLPTEYFNRQAMQQQYDMNLGQQPQYNQFMHDQHMMPQMQFQQQPMQFNNNIPQFSAPIQQPPARLSLPQSYQVYGQPPLIQGFGLKQQEPPRQNYHQQHDYQHQDYSRQPYQTPFQEEIPRVYGERSDNLSRKQLGLAPSTSTQIQSVAKFNNASYRRNY